MKLDTVQLNTLKLGYKDYDYDDLLELIHNITSRSPQQAYEDGFYVTRKKLIDAGYCSQCISHLSKMVENGICSCGRNIPLTIS